MYLSDRPFLWNFKIWLKTQSHPDLDSNDFILGTVIICVLYSTAYTKRRTI